MEGTMWGWGRDIKDIRGTISHDGKKERNHKATEIVHQLGERFKVDHRVNITN
jgi:hypothetical protein